MKNILVIMICLSVVNDALSSGLKPAERKRIALEKYAKEVFVINPEAGNSAAEIDRLISESKFKGHRKVAVEVFTKRLQATMPQEAAAMPQSRPADQVFGGVKRVPVQRVPQVDIDLPYKLGQESTLPYNFAQHMLSIARFVAADAKKDPRNH